MSTLAVDGTTAVGASSITLDGATVIGTLPIGITFTIAGDATVYTTTNAVDASSNSLAAVTFSPVLAAEAADDAVVTLTAEFATYTFPCAVLAFEERDITGTTTQSGDRTVVLDITGNTVVPSDDDQLTVQGKVVSIESIKPFKPGDDLEAIRLHARGF